MVDPAVLRSVLQTVAFSQKAGVVVRHSAAMVVNPKDIGWTNVLSKSLAGPNESKLLQRAGHTATAVGTDIYVIGGKTA